MFVGRTAPKAYQQAPCTDCRHILRQGFGVCRQNLSRKAHFGMPHLCCWAFGGSLLRASGFPTPTSGPILKRHTLGSLISDVGRLGGVCCATSGLPPLTSGQRRIGRPWCRWRCKSCHGLYRSVEFGSIYLLDFGCTAAGSDSALVR